MEVATLYCCTTNADDAFRHDAVTACSAADGSAIACLVVASTHVRAGPASCSRASATFRSERPHHCRRVLLRRVCHSDSTALPCNFKQSNPNRFINFTTLSPPRVCSEHYTCLQVKAVGSLTDCFQRPNPLASVLTPRRIMASYNMRMRAVKIVCFALFSLFFGQERAALSLNVDQAREALSAGDNSSYTVMHAPPNEGTRKLAEEDDDDKGEGSEEVSSSFLDEDADEEDDDSEDGKLSFLEDTDESDLEEEDYDLDAMDDEDAQMVADSMDGEERTAFLQRWEAHKADRKINGSPDERGAFAEF